MNLLIVNKTNSMRRLALSGFLLLFSGYAKPDVIYSPYTDYGIVLSFEGIGIFEKPFSKFNTINLWGGFGAVSVPSELNHPAFGGEIAIELRQYFSRDKFSGLNLGLYSGLAFMRYPAFYNGRVTRHENSVGFVPGLKLTYKSKINSWLIAEPYIGISTPWYSDNLSKLSDWISHSDPGLILTLGLRIGFGKVLKKK